MQGFYAHPTACVDEPSDIGEGTQIWHFCHVMAGASVGRNVMLGQNVFVASTARIGDGSRVQNNVSVYDGVVLENDVFLGPSCVFTNVVRPRAALRQRDAFRTTRVKTGATIGANATVLPGVTIGRYAFVGAGAVVTHDVADHALVVGVPARQVGWVDPNGVELSPDPTQQNRFICSETGARYELVQGQLVAAETDEDRP